MIKLIKLIKKNLFLMEPTPLVDKTKFGKTISTTGIKFPSKLASTYLKEYRNFLFNQEKIPNIVKDFTEDNQKLLLLNSQYKISEVDLWPRELQELIKTNNYEAIKYDVKLSYDEMSMQEILQQLLPSDVMIPGGFETVGTIAHLNLRKNQLPFKEIIGQVLLDKNKTINCLNAIWLIYGSIF